MKKTGLFLSVCILACAVSVAQPVKVSADKIIGIVGNKIVMKSDIDDRLSDMARQGADIPENGKCFVLQDMLATKALVLQAEKDSLPVSDEDVDDEIDTKIRAYINQFGGKDKLEEVAGKTVYQLKEDMRDPMRDQKLALAMRNKIVDNIRITPKEVQEYFQKIPTDSLPYYETEVEIGQLIVYPKANRDAEEYAKQQLLELKQKIESGKISFENAAKNNSDEPGADQTGGRMEINRNQKDIDPTFMAKAFTLKEGQVSNPFKSKFGYHILTQESRNGEDAVVRHVIKIPQVTAIELKQGYDQLDTVRAKLIAGTMDFGTAVDRYSNDDLSKFTAGMLQSNNGTFLTIDQLDKDMIPILKTLKPGGFSQPAAYTDPNTGKKGVRIVYLKSQTDPHRENLKDDYNKVSTRALEEKKDNALEQWFTKKLGSYYIMIDPAYRDCEVMKLWVASSDKYKTSN